jgi:hypothetical protein
LVGAVPLEMNQVGKLRNAAPLLEIAHGQLQPESIVDALDHHGSKEVISAVQIEIAMLVHIWAANRPAPDFGDPGSDLSPRPVCDVVLVWAHVPRIFLLARLRRIFGNQIQCSL